MKRATTNSKLKYALMALVLLVLTFGIWIIKGNRKAEAPNNIPEVQQNEQPEVTVNEKPTYQTPKLQPTINKWLKKQSANYHIVVWDAQSKAVIGKNDANNVKTAASLYKVFVAYLGLVDFQSGAQNPNEILLADQTKKQCIDKMIRSSDEPCGFAMVEEMGRTSLKNRIAALGMKNTSFAYNNVLTTANDSAKILELILQKKHLNNTNTAFLLDAMLKQDPKYKRGLQSGAPNAKWYSKVGYNLVNIYHDIGIMKLKDGRQFVVAILCDGNGSPTPIANFAKTIYSALTN